MSTRPEILFPLFQELTTLDGIGKKNANYLNSIGIEKPRDLIFTLPYTGVERQKVNSVNDAALPKTLTVEVQIVEHVVPKVKSQPYKVMVLDAETKFGLVFFHVRKEYLKKTLPVGERRVVSGKVELFDGFAQMVHPDHIISLNDGKNIDSFEPTYPLTAGISKKLITRAARSAIQMAPMLAEWIDPREKSRSGWPDWKAAIEKVHHPKSLGDINPFKSERLRLAYDEFLAHQLALGLARDKLRKSKGTSSNTNGALRAKVLSDLPFDLTGAQIRTLSQIYNDMASQFRMNRLLQGDVGSGKTLVAFLALLVAVEAGGQGVFMAPTEILAQQHLNNLMDLAKTLDVQVDILTGRDKGRTRKQKLTRLNNGDIKILLGTHAVFQKDVFFRDLRLVVIDEQHRFGVRQRLELCKKGPAADILAMTATPIPRSLALAQYGDMDFSFLDEKPPGRKPIKTVMLSADRIEEVIGKLIKAVERGRQAYWVCPLVEESEILDYISSEDRFIKLQAILGEGMVGLIHGNMASLEKDLAVQRFAAGQTKVLVATTVIEVGLNVPNASIMIIERAEIFGLAQLHQLRGRIGRGSTESTCLLLYKAPLSPIGRRRLGVLRETEDGFVISQTDLEMRGSGDFIGTAQSGLPKFRIADLQSMSNLMAKAQSDARTLLTIDPNLTSERGQAARLLLWLMEQDKIIHLISAG